MLEFLRWPFLIFIWTVSIMSTLGILREVAGIFWPNILEPKPIFRACVLIAFIVSAFTLYYIEHQKIIKLEKLQATGLKKRQIREDLAVFMGDRYSIQDICLKGKSYSETNKAYEDWSKKVDQYFKEKMDWSYHFKFESSKDYPQGVAVPDIIPDHNKGVWGVVFIRINNLEKIIDENK